MRKEQVLKIEKFRDGEEENFLIHSPREIQLLLQAIAKNRAPVIMYFDDEKRFIKTLLLGATENGVWLDVAANDDDNKAFLLSDHIQIVTLHQGAKVQFACQQPVIAVYAANPAYFFPLPAQMVRLQRREYYRLNTTGDTPLKCIIPPHKGRSTTNHDATILDISVGGISLSCKETGIALQEGEIYKGCRINLPEVGTLTADIEVRNLYDVTTPSGAIIKHAGCQFLNLDNQQTLLLQRYIGQMQRNAASSRMQ